MISQLANATRAVGHTVKRHPTATLASVVSYKLGYNKGVRATGYGNSPNKGRAINNHPNAGGYSG